LFKLAPLVLPDWIRYAQRMRIFLILLCLVVTFPSHAAAYKWLDEDGNVVFGDSPPADRSTEEIKQAPLNIYKNPLPKSTTSRTQNKTNSAAKTTNYTKLAILQPQDDMALRNNSGQLTITLQIEPPLNRADEHKIHIKLDGVKIAVTSGNSATIDNIDRGTHTVTAELVDMHGKVLKSSATHTFHLLRHSTL